MSKSPASAFQSSAGSVMISVPGELREQDYGGTPLNGAAVHRNERIIRILVARGADTTNAMDLAQRGLAGGFEYDPCLDREGYREIVALLQQLGVD